MKDFKRYLVTAALPYANGPVHIGHMAGVICRLIFMYVINGHKKEI